MEPGIEEEQEEVEVVSSKLGEGRWGWALRG